MRNRTFKNFGPGPPSNNFCLSRQHRPRYLGCLSTLHFSEQLMWLFSALLSGRQMLGMFTSASVGFPGYAVLEKHVSLLAFMPRRFRHIFSSSSNTSRNLLRLFEFPLLHPWQLEMLVIARCLLSGVISSPASLGSCKCLKSTENFEVVCFFKLREQ